jgi:hypothetical protein
MRVKFLIISMLVVFVGGSLWGKEPVTFLEDGTNLTEAINDMLGSPLKFQYVSGRKIPKYKVWMINFIDNNWNFPEERKQVTCQKDTIFLKNGNVLMENIVNYNNTKRVFDFEAGGSVRVGEVTRIYICGTKIPWVYEEKIQEEEKYESTTFLLDRRIINSPLKYLNLEKTGFMDGLQINTKDIWLINFENEQWNFPQERWQLSDKKLDTIVLTSGSVTYDKVQSFNQQRGTFQFENIDPLHYSKIKRIYFKGVKTPPRFPPSPWPPWHRGNKVTGKNRN